MYSNRAAVDRTAGLEGSKERICWPPDRPSSDRIGLLEFVESVGRLSSVL